MTLLLAAALFASIVVVWLSRSSFVSTVRESLPAPATQAPRGSAPVQEGVPAAPGGSLAVVAVAVDEIAAATNQLEEALASEARAEVAGALRAAVRRKDLCTPWRDQLVIAVLPGVELGQTAALRLRVQRALSELRIVTHAGEEISIGFRVASACSPVDGTSEADLLEAAEQRLAQERPSAMAPADDANARLCDALPILSN